MAYLIIIFYLLYSTAYGIPIENKTRLGLRVPEKIRAYPRTAFQIVNFIDLAILSDVFIDKTLLIKEIMEDPKKVIYISTPRKWGKSVQLDMIKQFFSIEVDQNGTQTLPLEETKNYKFFMNGTIIRPGKETRQLQTPFLISQHTDFVKEYLGQRPVITIFIGYDCSLTPIHRHMFLGTMDSVVDAYERHAYLRNIYNAAIANKTADEYTKIFLNNFNAYAKGYHALPEEASQDSVRYLSKLLYFHFKKKCIILIDMFKFTLESVFGDDFFHDEDIHKFTEFFTGFLKKSLLENEYAEKVVIMGEIVPPETWMNGTLENASFGNFLTGKYMEYFGFNQHEMQLLYKFHKTTDSRRKEIEDWYSGFKVNNRDLYIYNPYSVVHCLRRRRVEWFWTRTKYIAQTVRNFCELDQFREKFSKLLEGKTVSVQLPQRYLRLYEYIEVLRIWCCYADAPRRGKSLADKGLMLFFEHGYLALAEDCVEQNIKPTFKLKIPNKEILLTLTYDWKKFWDRGGPQNYTTMTVDPNKITQKFW